MKRLLSKTEWKRLRTDILTFVLLIVVACSVTEPTKPQCQEVDIRHVSNDTFIIFWIPTLDPAHSGLLIYLDGEPANMCRRTTDLKISDTGRWSIFATSGQSFCIDRDPQIFEDDCECTSTIP